MMYPLANVFNWHKVTSDEKKLKKKQKQEQKTQLQESLIEYLEDTPLLD